MILQLIAAETSEAKLEAWRDNFVKCHAYDLARACEERLVELQHS